LKETVNRKVMMTLSCDNGINVIYRSKRRPGKKVIYTSIKL